MKPTRINSAPSVPKGTQAAVRSIAMRSTAVCSTLWMLGPLAVAVPLSAALALAGAGGDWFGAVWLAAVLWAVAASLVQAVWQGLRQGDWSAFTYCYLPRNDDDFDYATRTGKFAHLRIRAVHEALVREGDRFLHNHNHGDSRT